MINLNHINISYKHVVLDDANISLAPHQIISLVGKSGIGKTSLLNIIGLLSAVNSKTEYYFNSYKIDLQNDEEMSLFRKQHIGYVFQEKNMLNNLTIKENFKLIANLSNEKYSDEKAIQYLKKVQLSININRYPDSLSGGERQRLSIALALYKKPELLLLDEPTSALDQRNKDILMEILKDITQSTDTIVLIVTHDKFIKENSDIVYTIENKKIKLLSGDLAQSNTKLKQSSLISLKLFLREYSYKQFKTNKKLYLMSLSILGIILGCCLFFGTFSKQYLDYMHEEYNQSRLTEIRVSSELFNEKTQSLLEGIDNIVTVYPYANDYVFKIVSNSVELNGNYQIEYYNSRMTGQIGVLIDENLSKDRIE